VLVVCASHQNDRNPIVYVLRARDVQLLGFDVCQPTGSPVQWSAVLVLIGVITELNSAAWPGDQQAFCLCSRLEQRRDKRRRHAKLFTTRPIKISNVCQTKTTGVSLSNRV
jgi:hypothetical protein